MLLLHYRENCIGMQEKVESDETVKVKNGQHRTISKHERGQAVELSAKSHWTDRVYGMKEIR